MRKILFAAIILFSNSSYAQGGTPEKIAQATMDVSMGQTRPIDLEYKFRKGDLITIEADASSPIQSLLLLEKPGKIVGLRKNRQNAKMQYEMPEDGTLVFRFELDASASSSISYKIVKQSAEETDVPADAAVPATAELN